MGSVLRYLLAGLGLSAFWLLVALSAIPGGMAQIEEFSLYGWPALGLLFLVPLALIWGGLWLVRLQRRVARLQRQALGYADGPAQGPSYSPPDRPAGHPDRRGGAEPAEARADSPHPEPDAVRQDGEAGRIARSPRRVAYSDLEPLPVDPETAHAELRAASHASAGGVPPGGVSPGGGPPPAQDRYGDGRGGSFAAARHSAPPPPVAPASTRSSGGEPQPRRARLPEPDGEEPDTAAEPLSDSLEPHRPPRAAPDAPRLEALTPTYRNPSDIPSKALSAEQFAQYEARMERELNAIAMDLASIVSAPGDYDRALDALNSGTGDTFFQLLARDFQTAHPTRLGEQLAMVGGDGVLHAYLEKYEQLLVVAYRSDSGGRTVKRLVESAMGRLHQAIESFRQYAPGG